MCIKTLLTPTLDQVTDSTNYKITKKNESPNTISKCLQQQVTLRHHCVFCFHEYPCVIH